MSGERARRGSAPLRAWIAAAAVAGCATPSQPATHDAGPRISPAASGDVPGLSPFWAARRTTKEPTAREALGRLAFFDERLSTPPGTSCAGCHDPARAFSGNHGSTVGVAQGSRPGHFARRNTPSILYLEVQSRPSAGARGRRRRAPSPLRRPRMERARRFDRRVCAVAAARPRRDEQPGRRRRRCTRSGKPYADDFAAEFPGAAPGADRRLPSPRSRRRCRPSSRATRMAPFTSKYDDWRRGVAELRALEGPGTARVREPGQGRLRRVPPPPRTRRAGPISPSSRTTATTRSPSRATARSPRTRTRAATTWASASGRAPPCRRPSRYGAARSVRRRFGTSRRASWIHA